MVSSIIAIPTDRRDEWQALLRRSFSKRWGREYLRRDFFLDYATHDPHHRTDDLVGLTVGDALASTYQVFRRRMVIGDRTYHVEGIGNVATDVRFQGHGYGTLLLRDYLRSRVRGAVGFVYAREGELYRRLGWRRLRRHMLTVSRAAITDITSRGPLRVRRMGPSDLPALARIYSRFNRIETLPHIVRSTSYWARWVSWKVKIYRLGADVFLEGDRPVGYMFSRRTGRTLLIDEYGALPSARDLVYDAILLAFAGARRATTLHVMRPACSLKQFLDSIGVDHDTSRVPHDTGHAVIRHPVLRSSSHRLGVWHVDHF